VALNGPDHHQLFDFYLYSPSTINRGLVAHLKLLKEFIVQLPSDQELSLCLNLYSLTFIGKTFVVFIVPLLFQSLVFY